MLDVGGFEVAVLLAFVTAVLAVENPVRVEAPDVTIPPGSTGNLRVSVVIPEGHHVYRDKLTVEVVDHNGLQSGPVSYPPAAVRPDLLDPTQTREVYETDALVDIPVTVPASVATDVALGVHVAFLACKEGFCYPPKEEDLSPYVRLGVATQAAAAAEEIPVSFSAKAGKPGEIVIHGDLHGDWHINRAFVGVTLTGPPGYTLGEAVVPPGVKTGSEADGTAREDLEHDFDITVPVTGPVGKADLAVDVAYQACKGVALCKMPTSEAVVAPVVIGEAGITPAEPPATASAGGGFEAAAQQGALALLALCFLAGVGVSFTPCVLPMVPITMGLIGARGAGSRLSAVALSGSYVLGQAIVYTALGVMAGVTGALFGSAMQSPWLVGGIAIFFVIMGAGMFGFFDLQVPSAIQSRISGFDKRGGHAVAFVFGMIGAVLAGPCSGPVVFAILGVIATGGQVAWGAALMFAFALGMGMIFLVTGAATGWLPARGAWMVLVKKSFGVVMWLGAIYYAKSLLTDVQVALATSAVLLCTAVFGWPHADDGEGFWSTRIRQLYGIVGGVVGAYLLVGTLVTEGFILPPVRMSAASAPSQAVVWLRTEQEGIAAAQASGKPLMIDFTAEWCAACHEMEKYTYTDAAVVAAAKDFVPVMIDCTSKDDPVVKAVQEKYKVSGLPTVVFATADGTILHQTVGFVEAQAFVAEMRKARG